MEQLLSINQDFLNESEMIAEWHYDNLIFKLLQVSRETIEEESDELMPAFLTIGIDDAGVRRFCCIIDPVFDSKKIAQDVFAEIGMPIKQKEEILDFFE